MAKQKKADHIRKLAESIADQLMTSGGGKKADRLVLEGPPPFKQDLGGRCWTSVVDAIESRLRMALPAPGATP